MYLSTTVPTMGSRDSELFTLVRIDAHDTQVIRRKAITPMTINPLRMRLRAFAVIVSPPVLRSIHGYSISDR
ncbi:hypothetical protein [Bacillus thuringiensis]|uniref:hypothetical protein n=1 Tax=Bacillus thuringiensis TaxID=1428 RepID=UPI002075C95D|nr:hypothetical protein [Bacillus thuringiensis]